MGFRRRYVGLFYDVIGNEIGVEMALAEANRLNVAAAVAMAKAVKDAEEEARLRAEQEEQERVQQQQQQQDEQSSLFDQRRTEFQQLRLNEVLIRNGCDLSRKWVLQTFVQNGAFGYTFYYRIGA